MLPGKYQFGIMAVMALGLGAVFAVQRETTERLRAEIVAMRRENAAIIALRAEHQRLAALQVSSNELASLQAEHTELAQLRQSMETIAQKARAIASKPSSGSAAPMAEENEMIPARDWKNAGRATPAATLETVLWAAAGGDIDLLTQLIKLDGKSRATAEAILAGLPENLRATYSTPERLMALLGAKDAPSGGMEVVKTTEFNPDNTGLVVMLENSDGKKKTTVLGFRRDPEGWKLVVPEEVVEKYGRDLIGAAQASPAER